MGQAQVHPAEHGHKEVAVEELWKKSEENPVIVGLRAGKNFQALMDGRPEFKAAFREIPEVCGCSDGRIHDHRLARAGQGILVGVAGMIESFKKMDEVGQLGGTLEITSHAGCGAAKIVCDQLKAKGELPADYAPDQLGVKFAQDLTEAAKAAFPDKQVAYRHIEAEAMDAFHGERAIYFDLTGRIDPQAASDLPMGFVFTRLDPVPAETTKQELAALCGIALGDHGFGQRFSIENPFRIVVSANDQAGLDESLALATEVAGGFDGKVAVDGFLI